MARCNCRQCQRNTATSFYKSSMDKLPAILEAFILVLGEDKAKEEIEKIRENFQRIYDDEMEKLSRSVIKTDLNSFIG